MTTKVKSLKSMMRLPKKIKIAPLGWTFVRKASDMDKSCHKQLTKEDPAGLTNAMKLQFFIHKDLAPDSERETAMHEVCHGIVYTHGLVNLLDSDEEERVVSAFGIAFLSLVRDNPTFIKYLQESG